MAFLSLLSFSWINFDTVSAIIFLLVIGALIIVHRKRLTFQQLVHIGKMPIVYAVLWKTQFGIKFMDRVAKKHRETVKLIGTCFIGFGFFGLVYISLNILYLLFKLFTEPKVASEGVSLILPLTHIPGVGYLSFWHFLITLFIVVLVHEFAHGILARAHNIPVKSSGVGVLGVIAPVFPLAFVEPDEKKMAKGSDIAQYSVLSAGPMINIVMAMVVMLLVNFAFTPLEGKLTHPVGFSFTETIPGYGAEEVGLKPEMVINTVNGKEALEYQNFSKIVGDVKPGETITFGTEKGNFIVTTKPAPDNPERGYIGIKGIQNERRINEGYQAVGPTFFWFKGLLRWLYFLNLAIGLMNLLPLLVTDGGRMLKLALEKTCRTEHQAQKVWGFIGMLFIFTLVAAFVVKYVGGIFS